MEELANLKYSGLKINDYVIGLNTVEGESVLDANTVTIDDVANKIRDRYVIKEVVGEETITDMNLSQSAISINKGSSANVDVIFTSSSKEYYVLILGKYYSMKIEGKRVVIGKEGKKENELDILTVTSANNNIKATIDGNNKIKVEDKGNSVVTAKVTAKYGNIERDLYVSVVDMPTDQSIPDTSNSFSRNYGTIDVIWLDTNNNVINEPNAPDLYNNSLKKVTWTKSGDTWEEDSSPKSTWYNYNAVTTRESSGYTTDNNLSMWANAKNPADGSYFVWIPRYAYRITYYESETSLDPTGYCDGWGFWRASDGSVFYALDNGIETVEYNGNKYIVHPAFETNLDNGGWDKDLAGIWVAKYEISQENYIDGSWVAQGKTYYGGGFIEITPSNQTSIRLVSKPSTPSTIVSSWRYISIGKIYNNVYRYDRTKESHLMKNSEWGAVAYLTHSQYGRNGREIDVNNSYDHLTGNGGGGVGENVSTAAGITNYYNTTVGAKASTTGNIYGIYDMNGGAWEYTAAWDAASTSSYILSQGSSFASSGGASTKYATAYSNGTDTNYGSKVYEVSKIGDAIKETYTEELDAVTESRSISWFNDNASFANSTKPFFLRGGQYNHWVYAGVFYSCYGDGCSDTSGGYRAVLGQ